MRALEVEVHLHALIGLGPLNLGPDSYWPLFRTYLLESLRRRKIVIQEELHRRKGPEDLVDFSEWQLPHVVAQAPARAPVASCSLWSRGRLIWFDGVINLNLSVAVVVTCRCLQELMPAYRWVMKRRRLVFAVDWC
jgi:hypothetical protein